MSLPEPLQVGIDILDAAELADTCHYLTAWIAQAPAEVTDNLARFTTNDDALAVLLDALGYYTNLLDRLIPTAIPNHDTASPLSPGGTIGLAEILTDLAANGWPTDPHHAQTLRHDCRHWALRILHAPGVTPDTVNDMSTTQHPATARPSPQPL